jgi:hypothetical protein
VGGRERERKKERKEGRERTGSFDISSFIGLLERTDLF